MGEAVDAVIASEDYPASRELLYGLMSELRVRTSNLPLVTYPAALAEAARLLDQKKRDEISDIQKQLKSVPQLREERRSIFIFYCIALDSPNEKGLVFDEAQCGY